ncbi:MarR family winged helix-turn-helix transcriptional regulator [Streptomyces virginiae]|uniref:MarR family winged helix-turn-helix transcriptional regulator n=1 Tax=Streptomyces virginiae TaxID=1961 RepID=UPI002DBFE00E|nr:helix-turn-helix domain-containing protein [Streptomyces sp. CMAA1738]MEC4569692.1 helix-turn-helix domain-containing protein [Streptomyces sp. CMAA1738]
MLEPLSPPGSTRTRQDLLSRTALGVFRLNGQFLSLSEELARPAGLTAAWWQVLGAVLREPLPVAGIARNMGITRQSVQRIADLLVAKGLAEYAPNPAHRRAKLLRPTQEGRAAVDRIGPGHAAMAARLAAELGDTAFAETVRVLERLAAALDTLPAPRDAGDPRDPGDAGDAADAGDPADPADPGDAAAVGPLGRGGEPGRAGV